MTELPSNTIDSAPKSYDCELLRSIKVHNGFLSAFQTVQMKLFSFIDDCSQNKRLFICGHSLGGALAVLTFLFLLLQPRPLLVHGIYTLGQPKVGNTALGRFLVAYGHCKLQRVCNRGDLVPSLPPKRPYGFKPCGTLVFIKGSGELLYEPSEKELSTLRLQRLFKYGVNDHRIANYVCQILVYFFTLLNANINIIFLDNISQTQSR